MNIINTVTILYLSKQFTKAQTGSLFLVKTGRNLNLLMHHNSNYFGNLKAYTLQNVIVSVDPVCLSVIPWSNMSLKATEN